MNEKQEKYVTRKDAGVWKKSGKNVHAGRWCKMHFRQSRVNLQWLQNWVRLAIITLEWTAHDCIWNISCLTCADTFPKIKDNATLFFFFRSTVAMLLSKLYNTRYCNASKSIVLKDTTAHLSLNSIWPPNCQHKLWDQEDDLGATSQLS